MSNEEKNALQVEREKLEHDAKVVNDSRSGVGLRRFVGATRGKGTMNITYEAFDVSKPDTLPGSLEQFTQVTGVTDSELLLSMLIDGFNSYQYTQASDPIAEYVDPSWDKEIVTAFRNAVRSISKFSGQSLDVVAEQVKAGFKK